MTHEARCIGCLLGTACGDILGAGVEGWAASEIRQQYGEVHDFLETDRGFGCYTDEWQRCGNGQHGAAATTFPCLKSAAV
jgi:ADP-ribosylglycohydrolase